jgi:hypothetical protein
MNPTTNPATDPIRDATDRRLAAYADLAPFIPSGAKITGRKRSSHSRTHSLGMNGKRRSRDAR